MHAPHRSAVAGIGATLPVLLVLIVAFNTGARADAPAAPLGQFTGQSDVGAVAQPGSTEFDAAGKQYKVTGNGANIWAAQDAFHYLWRKADSDLSFSGDIQFVGQGKDPHRKACWMVRQTLDADSAYADVAVHGDGLISLQYRPVAGGPTLEVKAPVKAPATVRLDRDGDLFTLSVAQPGRPPMPVGAVTVPMHDPVYVGLAVSSHNIGVSETANFSNVKLETRTLAPGQKRVRETSLETLAIATGQRTLVYRAIDYFEAPNWTPDNRLLINRKGGIYAVPAAGGEPTQVDLAGVTRCNNDHGLSPDGKWLAISHQEHGPSVISIVSLTGAATPPPRQITPTGPSYWHGWSPDGKTLAFCGQRNGNFDIYTVPAAGGPEQRLTDAEGLDDGPDYSPDGQFIYFNSERTGVMKIWRMHPDGTNQEQVTREEQYADWFPHPSPDGKWLAFLSFSKDIKGHPENQNVVLRLMPAAGGKPKTIATLFGGQGTINVPSWSPDSKSVAFVSYRFVVPPAAAPAR
jgi:hypothetical protein